MSESLQSKGNNNNGIKTVSEAVWKSLAKEVALRWELKDEEEPPEGLQAGGQQVQKRYVGEWPETPPPAPLPQLVNSHFIST